MADCLLCGNELRNIEWTVTQEFEVVKFSKIPFGWMFLSPNETDPNLVETHYIPMPKEKKGAAVCSKCGAECELVMSGGETGDAIVTSCGKENNYG